MNLNAVYCKNDSKNADVTKLHAAYVQHHGS